MNEDSRFLLRGLGCLPAALGAIVMALGALYAAMEWRYGGAIFIWSVMWGLMLSGVGLAVMSTGRRWMALLGVAGCFGSALLVYFWERHHELGWGEWIYSGDALGGVIGLAAIVASFWQRPGRSAQSAETSEP